MLLTEGARVNIEGPGHVPLRLLAQALLLEPAEAHAEGRVMRAARGGAGGRTARPWLQGGVSRRWQQGGVGYSRCWLMSLGAGSTTPY